MAQKKRLSVVQIIGCLWEAEAEVSIKDLCRRHGLSDADDYLWRSKFGGMNVSDAKHLKALPVSPRQKSTYSWPSTSQQQCQ